MKELVAVCTTIVMVLGMGVAGCSYTVSQSNRLYYESMNLCTKRGGTFIPAKGQGEIACVSPQNFLDSRD